LINISTSPKNRWQQFLAKLLVRFKWVKKAPVEIDEINQLVNQQLPVVYDLATPGGRGELSILEMTITIPSRGNCLQAELLCNFSASVKQTVIYNTHLQLTLDAQPDYCQENKMIGVSNVRITALNLISDQYSLIKDTRTLMSSLLPEPFKSIFNITLSSTQVMLKNKTVNGIVKYLSLYSSGSKQRVIDYHRADIEQQIIQATQNSKVKYRLDESVFEEKLFAEYGQKITIEDGRVYFIFHS